MTRDLDRALELFDPDDGVALELIETPRDAKRASNALAAALPLVPADADAYVTALEIVLRTLVPEVAGPRLDARARMSEIDRETWFAELSATLAGRPRASAARLALRALVAESPGPPA